MEKKLLFALFILSIILGACKKSGNSSTTPTTSKLFGTRTYHGNNFGSIISLNDSGTKIYTPYNDTITQRSVSISDVGNDSIRANITLYGDSYTYFSKTKIDSVNNYVLYSFGPNDITYYFLRDSICIKFRDNGTGAANNIYLFNP